jgi:phage recombination protein Bet
MTSDNKALARAGMSQQVVAQEEGAHGAVVLTRAAVADLVASGYIPKGTPDGTIRLYARICAATGLSPIKRQIHLVARWTKDGTVYTPQTGIDGYRFLADMTGKYMAGREPQFLMDKEGNLISATAYVKRLHGVEWHEVAATAFYSEYVQTNKEGQPNAMWRKSPHVMLAKCAEALALRRAFPGSFAGLYTDEEMGAPTHDYEPTGLGGPTTTRVSVEPQGAIGNEPSLGPGGTISGPNPDPDPDPEAPKPTSSTFATLRGNLGKCTSLALCDRLAKLTKTALTEGNITEEQAMEMDALLIGKRKDFANAKPD